LSQIGAVRSKPPGDFSRRCLKEKDPADQAVGLFRENDMKPTPVVSSAVAALVLVAACGSRDAERAAPEAASMETEAATGVAGANPGSVSAAGAAASSAREVDRAGQEGSTPPPPG
jgi:hypothetical protein